MTDRPAQAIESYQRSIESADRFMPSYLGLAQAFYRQKDYDQATEAASQAVALKYTNAVAHFMLATALEAGGQLPRAEQEYAATLQFAPGHQEAREALERLTGRPPSPGDASGEAESRERSEVVRRAARDALLAIGQWQSDVADSFTSADKQLDEYLAANAAPAGKAAPESAVISAPSEKEWTVRPAMAADQPIIRRVFPDAFEGRRDRSIYLIHPSGTDDIQGILTTCGEQDGEKVTLGVAVRGRVGQEAPDQLAEWVMCRLLRAGVARAAAGGAKQVALALDDREDPAALGRSLDRLGFEVAFTQTVWHMSMGAFRDRCLGLVDRYRRRKSIPADIRLVTLGDVPFPQAHEFLSQFFPDGAGRPLHDLYAPVSRVMLKGNEIIACFVGYKKNAKTFLVSRLGVLPEQRGLWVTPWLLGDGSRKAFEEGHTVIEFHTDEERYPDFIKIARGMKADHVGTITNMTLDLAIPWPQP
jgi:hypothetical protein